MSEEQGHSADAVPMEITLSTNWIVGGGSLDNAFSFETTAEDTPATAASRGGVLLLRPMSLDSLPGEVTVSFREKHEIRQVYVKSTARTYEIYYASDQPNDNEYLCTVRCGAAFEEVRTTAGDEIDIVQGDNSLLGQMPRCDSTVSTEDACEEVKIPGTVQEDGVKSPPTVVDTKCNSNFQINYEATAEISDASPCISITIRFLSLQAKDSLHIEEIYIYADPIGSSCPDSSVSIGGSVGENSLLAMLVPSLMQLSKASPASRSEVKRLDLKGQSAEEKAPATNSLDRHEPEHRGTFRSSGEEDTGTTCKTKVASENTKSTCSHHASDPDNMLMSILEENTKFYARFETLLDKLVTRVERVEAYCSSFEENMMRPLNRIDVRLLQLEQRLTTFTGSFDCSKELPYLKISAPEFASDESDVEDDVPRDARRNNAMNSIFADLSSSPAEMMCSMPGTQINPSLIVKEPAHEDDSSRNAHISINNTAFADLSSSPAKMTSSTADAQIGPSLIIKAPEFSGEDEDNIDEPSEFIANASISVKASQFYCDDEENVDETSDTMRNGCVRDKASSSLSSALASALEALLSSTAIEALRSSHGPMNESFVDSATALTSSATSITSAVFDKNVMSEIDVEILDNSCMQSSNDRASDDAQKVVCSDSQSAIVDICGTSLSKSETCQQDLCGTVEGKSLTILDDNVLVHHAKEHNMEAINGRHMLPELAAVGNSDVEQIFDTNACRHIHDRLSPLADTCRTSLSESETCQQGLCGTAEGKNLTILDDNVLVHHAKERNIEVIRDKHMSPEQAIARNSNMEQIDFDTNACGHIHDRLSLVANTCGTSLSESETCQQDLCDTAGGKSLTILNENVLFHHAKERNIEVIHDRHTSPEQAVAGNSDMEQIDFDTNACGPIHDILSSVADTCETSLSKSETCQQDLCGNAGGKSFTILDDNVLVHHAKERNIEVIHDRHMSPEQAVAVNSDMEQIDFDTNACGHIHDRLSPVADTCVTSLSESEACQQDLYGIAGGKSLTILDDNFLVHHANEHNIEVIHGRHTSPEQAVAGNSDMEQTNFDTNACGDICGVTINDEAFSHIIHQKAGSKLEVKLRHPDASNTDLEQRKDVTLDLEQSILDVKFTKERDSTTKDLLDALLGEVSFLEELATASARRSRSVQ